MALIKVKRSTGVSAPSSLETGEIAVTIEDTDISTYLNKAGRFFVGNSSNTPVEIGGQYYTKLLDHQPGLVFENSAIITGTASTIDNLNVVGIATISGTLSITGEFSLGSVSVGNSITVGTNTEGQNFYALSDGTTNVDNITISGLSTNGTGYSVIYLDDNKKLSNTSNFVWSDTESTLFVTGDVSVARTSYGVTGIFTTGKIETLRVGSSSTYDFPTAVGQTGQILYQHTDGNLKFITFDQTLNTIADSGSGSVGLSSEYFRIVGTDYEIETLAVGNTITIGLPDDVIVGGGLTVNGDMTVNGNLTYLSSTITQIEDKNIELAVPETGSPSDAIADGGGLTVKGNSDYTISWSNSRNEWVFNQSIGPTSSSLDLGSSSTRWGYLYVTRGDIVDLNATGVVTFSSLTLGSGSFENVTVGLGTSAAARFTDVGFTTASGGDTTLRTLKVTGISTVASLFLTDNLDTNGVAYAGTDGKVGFTSAPTAGISTSTYILTSLGGVPVYTDTIDCGTY